MSLYPAEVPHLIEGLPSGVDGVRATLAAMVKLARKYKSDIGILQLSRELIRSIPQGNPMGRITALQHFVRDRINYVPDPHDGPEMIQTPKQVLVSGTGDCDDKATLLSALLASVGFPTRFVAVGVDGGPYSHVLVQVKLGTRWIPLETILDGVEPGWFPPDATRFMVAHV